MKKSRSHWKFEVEFILNDLGQYEATIFILSKLSGELKAIAQLRNSESLEQLKEDFKRFQELFLMLYRGHILREGVGHGKLEAK